MRKLNMFGLMVINLHSHLRSKVKIDDYADVWSFDGSSTNRQQVIIQIVFLNPVAEYKTLDRIRADATQTRPGLEGTYVMCEVH